MAFSLGAQAIPETVESTLLPRQAGFASSSTSTSQFQSFASSWQSMSHLSFKHDRRMRSPTNPSKPFTRAIYRLTTSTKLAAFAGLAWLKVASQTEFQSSTRQMYSSLQSILTTGQQIYGAQWQSQFASVFQNMSSFGSFCQTVASSLQLDLSAVLSGLNLNLDIFAQVGLDIGSILGGGSSGGLLGGGSSGGLLGAFSLGAHAIPETVESTLLPRQAGFASSSTSASQFQSFASSWQSMSQSFTQTQSVFQAQSSYEVAYQSVQTLYQSYLSAYNQYQACSLCGAGLAQSGFQSEFQSSTRQMYSSLQSIITTGQQIYGAQWQSQFASVFQNMSSFGSFCQTVAGSLQLDLSAVLSGLNLNLDIFAQVGLDIGSILGGGSSGGLLGGGSSGGLLGGVLGSAGQNGGLIGGLLR
ncbi:hypothetical protein PSHT_06866 [Puccinia striiformis]|uniref:Uncharacterized protein n=1 Tax=Puccinia striiformis TaxID=27350 RepID=A0A2S4W2H9_9BASI|nr:hypothetical protein PSHT_06866 [Puccinia striiformis]